VSLSKVIKSLIPAGYHKGTHGYIEYIERFRDKGPSRSIKPKYHKTYGDSSEKEPQSRR
jgi:hypothetical protein